MRRRRGARAAWLPVIPTDYGANKVTWYETTLTFSSPVSPGDTSQFAIPLTFDDSSAQEQAGSIPSLRDRVEGQDYTLQRVVGKVWMSANRVQAFSDMELYELIGCIALAVLPADASTGDPALPGEEWNPLFSRNSQQPWIWRRTWRLDTPQVYQSESPLEFIGPQSYPTSTAGYHGLQEGGHLDTKGVKRRITKEHRLYLVAAAGVITSIEVAEPVPSLIDWGYDLRALGTMRRARNRSSF